MQVDPKPSPWPCVVMLVGLLVCCLAVPQFWQPSKPGDITPKGNLFTGNEEESAIGSPRVRSPGAAPALPATKTTPLGGFGFEQALVRPPVKPGSDRHLVAICPLPSIEELVASARSDSIPPGAGSAWRQADWSRWPTIPIPANSDDEQLPAAVGEIAVAAAEPNPLIATMLERIGNVLATYSLTDALIQVAQRAGGLTDHWSSGSAAVSRVRLPNPAADEMARISTSPAGSTVRLIGPDDRLAMLPAPAETMAPAKQPIATEPARPAAEAAPLPPAGEASTDADDPWCVPQVLLEQLERLSRHPISARWAQDTIAQLREVTSRANWNRGSVLPALDKLGGLADDATRLAETTSDDLLRVELLRAHWALSRRLACWRAIDEIRVAARTSGRTAARGSLHAFFGGLPPSSDMRPDLPALIDDLEDYESSRDPQLARQVVQEQESLRASPDALDQSLADAVEQHYRNANVRVAITAEMLNRLVAQQRSEIRAVRDWIAGTPVRGRSHTHSASFVRLEPAEGRWQLDLQAQGVVESDTLANGGRARLRSFGATDFTAQKSIVVDPDGVHLQSARADATNYNRLMGVRTELDWVPLLGAYARTKAIQQYRAKRPRSKAEVEAKVASQAQDDVDRETHEAVARIEHEVRSRFTDLIAQSGIEVMPIELTTTEERIVARLRVAGNHQLGSHTPRPRALSDSLASLQMHESALTNAAVSLQLDGARYTAPELQQSLRERFPRLALAKPTPTRSETVFEFAYRDAVQFRISNGRLELLLALIGFEHEGRKTRDFIVHAFYVPVVDRFNVELVREGPLGFEGRLSAVERARLHNAFNSVLAADRRLSLVRLEDADNPRLAGLMITQLVLEDGWLGVAVGPAVSNRVAERSRSLR